ncbi:MULTISPECIES: hypothetical protein [unclassified Eikenella]|nr:MULTISPECIES: hypothetical protein [unclassified Eikenella]
MNDQELDLDNLDAHSKTSMVSPWKAALILKTTMTAVKAVRAKFSRPI